MASSKDYLEYILDQLSDPHDISYRAMMGEYIIYYRGKIVGGIYDDRFLVKPTKSAIALMPDAEKELPYEGAKEMLLVDDVENREFLRSYWKRCMMNCLLRRKRNDSHRRDTFRKDLRDRLINKHITEHAEPSRSLCCEKCAAMKSLLCMNCKSVQLYDT